MIDLLYLNEESLNASINTEVLEDLRINEFLDKAIPENSWRQYFQEVLLHPLQDYDKILKRGELLEAIIKYNEIFEFIRTMFDSLENLKKIAVLVENSSFHERKALSFFILIKNYFIFINNMLLKYNIIRDKVHVSGLIHIGNQLELEYADANFNNIIQEINFINNALRITQKQRLGIRTVKGVKINYTFQQCEENQSDYELNNVSNILLIRKLCKEIGIENVPEKAKSNKKSSILPQEILDCIYSINNNTFNSIHNFYQKYRANWDEIYSKWFDLIDSLRFYLGAARLFKFLLECNMHISRAEVSTNESDITEAREIYDLSLIDKKNKVNVVFNDWIVRKDGSGLYVLTGDNQGGKTTYLRAIGIAHLLFQTCGYVPGTYARMHIVPGIYTHFTNNGEFIGIGRLAEEIKRINLILKSAQVGSLVLLNLHPASNLQKIKCQVHYNTSRYCPEK